MQALCRNDQFRIAFCIRLAPLAFAIGLANALPSTLELHHKPRFFVLRKRSSYLAHHDPGRVARVCEVIAGVCLGFQISRYASLRLGLESRLGSNLPSFAQRAY
jgi:hypothetical protein